jgi:hypothetical protein
MAVLGDLLMRKRTIVSALLVVALSVSASGCRTEPRVCPDTERFATDTRRYIQQFSGSDPDSSILNNWAEVITNAYEEDGYSYAVEQLIPLVDDRGIDNAARQRQVASRTVGSAIFSLCLSNG